MGSQKLQERLDALRAEYAATLPARSREAREHLEGALAGADTLEPVWQIVHRLHGTAGSYDFMEVAAAARRVEDLLAPHRGSAELAGLDVAELRERLDELARAAETASG
jgi:HPt (histidine-containing phosphotransfer) domain-containing protein